MKNTVTSLLERKNRGEKIAMVTAYDYTMARLVSAAGADMILVGDSLGMVMMGMPDTVSVTMDDMVHHTLCVSRGSGDALLVGDMPFLSFQVSVEDAVRNAGRLMKEGRAHAVKLEGGREVCPQVRAMTQAGIPVMGHIGLTPQSLNTLGGFHVQGKNVPRPRNCSMTPALSTRPAPSAWCSSACRICWPNASPVKCPA